MNANEIKKKHKSGELWITTAELLSFFDMSLSQFHKFIRNNDDFPKVVMYVKIKHGAKRRFSDVYDWLVANRYISE